nr:hypothetical protein [Tanacetum cinerariifolium]
MNFRKFLKDIDISDKTKMFEGFKDWCYVGENCAVGSELYVGSDEEMELIRKRKRKKECCLSLLDWVKRVAKDPCDPVIGLMLGSSKWKAYGSEHVWKQALLAKEAMVLKVNDDLNDNQSVWKHFPLKGIFFPEDQFILTFVSCYSQKDVGTSSTSDPLIPKYTPVLALSSIEL